MRQIPVAPPLPWQAPVIPAPWQTSPASAQDSTATLLTEDELLRIFHEQIAPRHSGIPSEHPVALVIVGQPGAGKSVAERQLSAMLGLQNTVSIDGDGFYSDHPAYLRNARRNDLNAMDMVLSQAVPRWGHMITEHAIHSRWNLTLGTSPSEANVAQLCSGLRSNGYRVELAFLAVNDAISRQGIIDRYLRGRATQGYGRWVDLGLHDRVYHDFRAAAGLVDQRLSADAVHVINRQGELLHTKRLVNRGGGLVTWDKSSTTFDYITAEQHREWTAEERKTYAKAWSRIERNLLTYGSCVPGLKMLVRQERASHAERESRARDLAYAGIAHAAAVHTHRRSRSSGDGVREVIQIHGTRMLPPATAAQWKAPSPPGARGR
ncbi:zeta toxin family protein [Streptomyces sp. AK02-01A]|uniref:zeta toxin family protein n=1 Tax=Streptomyces sp. AK02-01A TaxID=3028648 RepID=UPI0029B64E14|nr:zeta toxin family protein [Streptomyces sp. AK02-01A]MDX3850999.1 zeta toxin family protein [Streptomyces sp. AK02-01A]